MSSIKLIKFDLPIDGAKVRNIEELRDHFTVEIIDFYQSGVLAKWLKSRHLKEELEALETPFVHSTDRFTLMKRLCEIFKVEADDLLISLAVGEPREKAEKTFPELKAQYMVMIQKEVQIEAEAQKPTISSKYLIHKNGMVTDTQTKLMWKREHEVGKYTWDEAIKRFGKNVSFADYNDWRMPTTDELKTLIDKQYSPTIDPTTFPNILPAWFWSSTAKDASNAWYVHFGYGGGAWGNRYNGRNVRLVRSGQ